MIPMMKQYLLVFLSLASVGIGSAFAVMTWSLTVILDPLWHALFAGVSWVVGFVIGTRLFWMFAKRMQEAPPAP
jgi:hypothetical protein